ncbi:MAG: hypothetical protein CVV23_05760 [Ignavibacteriae bacterium HGW-Ignavibacteriae-2]|nr:MAG: hypothetical protein CVV23_05760 [Ignavibacteriae bacterium HGW-Ignavibacteriae-2]
MLKIIKFVIILLENLHSYDLCQRRKKRRKLIIIIRHSAITIVGLPPFRIPAQLEPAARSWLSGANILRDTTTKTIVASVKDLNPFRTKSTEYQEV